jgi:hypothetical protein
MMVPLFATLKYTGLLRVAEHGESIGLDLAVHGGPCYAEASEASPVPTLKTDLNMSQDSSAPACATDLIKATVEAT